MTLLRAQLASTVVLEVEKQVFYAMRCDEEEFKIHDARLIPSDAIVAEAVEPLSLDTRLSIGQLGLSQCPLTRRDQMQLFPHALTSLASPSLCCSRPRLVLAMDKDEAHDYLSSLLNQSLRIHTTDGRMFRGTFKCTDPVRLPAQKDGLCIFSCPVMLNLALGGTG